MKNSSRPVSRSGETPDSHGDQVRDLMAQRKTLELVRADYTLEKLIIRKRISKMLKSIATRLLEE